MNNHPVLSLLAKEEEPPYRVLQKTAALVAETPDVLLDLMGQDLSDDLLGLLETRNARFSRILLEEVEGNAEGSGVPRRSHIHKVE